MSRGIGKALLSALVMGMLLASSFVAMAGTPPPPSDVPNGIQYIDGNWTVAGTQSFTNEVIVLTGNLTVPAGTTLNLVNTTIMMNCTATQHFTIEVLGTLNMADGGDGFQANQPEDTDASVITTATAGNWTSMWVRSGATFNMFNSAIHNVGNLSTRGKLVGGDHPETNIATWQTNLYLHTDIDGIPTDWNAISFSGVASMDDVAQYLENYLRNRYSTEMQAYDLADVVWATDHFEVYSGTTGYGSYVNPFSRFEGTFVGATEASGLTQSSPGMYWFDLADNAMSVPAGNLSDEGVYIQTNNAHIEGSDFSANGHGVIFDTCYPSFFEGNTVRDNRGHGFLVVNKTTPNYALIDKELAYNAFTGNNGAGVWMKVSGMDVEIHHINVSENRHGVWLQANLDIQAVVSDCTIAHNNMGTYHMPSALNIWTSPNGEVRADIVNNYIVNNSGGVWLGYDIGGYASKNTYAYFWGNTLMGNDGDHVVQAIDNVEATFMNNDFGWWEGYYSTLGDGVRLGHHTPYYTGPSEEFCGNLTLVFEGNRMDYGHPQEGVDIGGVIRTAAKHHMDVSITDNTMWGGYFFGSFTRIGHPSPDNYDYTDPRFKMTDTVDLYVARNNLDLPWHWNQQPDFGGFVRVCAIEDIDATIEDNVVHSEGCSGFKPIWMGHAFDSGAAPAVVNLTANIYRNTFTIEQHEGTDIGGFIRLIAEENLVANIVGNYLEGWEALDSDQNFGGYIRMGMDSYTTTRHLTALVEGNTLIANTDNGNVGGFLWALAYESVDVDVLDNLFEFNHYPTDNAYIGGVMRIGAMDTSNTPLFTNATVIGNTIRISATDVSIGGTVWIAADENITATVSHNDIDIVTTNYDDNPDIGTVVRIGFDDSASIDSAENVVAYVNWNTIHMTCVNGAAIGGFVRIQADNNVTFEVNYNEMVFERQGDGGWSLGSLVRIGTDLNGPMIVNAVGTMIGNYIYAKLVDTSLSSGAAVHIAASESIDVDMYENVIFGEWYSEDASYDFGVRVGYTCENDGIQTNDVTLDMYDNIIGPGGRAGALMVGALENLDFTFDLGLVTGATYCTSYSTDDRASGTGIVLMSEGFMNATISNAEIFDNDGAGLWLEVEDDAWVDIDNCWIHDNGWHGIYLYSNNGRVYADGSITETVVENNGMDIEDDIGSDAYGLFVYSGDVYLENCTFDNPEADYELYFDELCDAVALNTYFDKESVFLAVATYGIAYGGPHAEGDFAQWATVTAGYFNITIDGITDTVGPVDFTGVTSMDDVRGRIQTALNAADPSSGFNNAIVNWNGTAFSISSGTSGMQSSVTPATGGTGSGTDISGLTASPSANCYWMDFDSNETTTEDGYSDNLLVQWYLHAKAVQQSSSVGLPGTSIEVRDGSNAVVGTGTTGADGFRRWFVVDEYFEATVMDDANNRTYYGPYDVRGTKAPAVGNTYDTDMDMTKQVDVVLNYVTQPPIANAGPDQTVPEDAPMTFNGALSDDDWSIVSYAWAFTDGGAKLLTGVAPSYTFAQPGTYTVTLTVTDYEGFTDTDTVEITVTDVTAPTANAGADQTVDENTTVTFNGTATDNFALANFTWTFVYNGTNQTVLRWNGTFTFAIVGDYLVTLTVNDTAGNVGMDTMWVHVLDITPPVVVAGDGEVIAEGETVSFDGSASADNVGIVGYIWSFNDGANDVVFYTAAFDYTFSVLGNHTITLMCWDAAGNYANGTTYVNVVDMAAPRVLVVAPGESLAGVPVDWQLIVVFTEPMDTASAEAAFSITGVNISTFTWNTDDRYVTIAFDGDLPLNITFDFAIATTATDLAGNALAAAYHGSFTTTAGVPEIAPFADAGSNQAVLVGAVATFNAGGSYDADGAIISYVWNFGDGTNATGITATHTYATAGTYTVTLTITDNGGQTSTDTLTVTVEEPVVEPQVEDEEEDFITTYWWIFIVIALIAVIVLQFVLGRKKPAQAETPEEKVLDEKSAETPKAEEPSTPEDQ